MNGCWSGRDLIELSWMHNSVEITVCNLTPHIFNTMVQKALVWAVLTHFPSPSSWLLCAFKNPGFRGWHIFFFLLYSLWDLIQVSTWILCLAEFTGGEQQRQMSESHFCQNAGEGEDKGYPVLLLDLIVLSTSYYDGQVRSSWLQCLTCNSWRAWCK